MSPVMVRTRYCSKISQIPGEGGKKGKGGEGAVCFRQLSIVLIIVPICNQDFGLPRRLDYDIHNSLVVSLLPIQ